MSTMDPTGDGGGGGTSVDDNVTPVTPSTGISMPPGSQHPQHPPPSPLSGCYLLVVLPEPHTAQHRDLILNRLAKGFLSWDKDSCHVDLEKELLALVAQAPEGEEARNGERLIQYATENLVTEVLIHPQTNTLLQCIRNLLASFTKHRHIIHAGYTFGGNGSWILQDGTFSLADFLDAFSEHEVQRVLRAYENSVTVDINCAGVGDWSTSRLSKEACTRSCRVRLNPDDVLTAGVPAIASFTNYVGQYLLAQTLDQLMEPSDVVGNIRFSHPTLYVFPGGQGDAALFGINGFNMLVDGGFARKACFWDFARHLDRLDAVLLTRINNSNVGGMSSVLQKKREMHVYPQIGHFFCNLVERRHSNSPDGDKDLDPLILNLTDIGQEMMVNLRQINLRAHPCYRDPNPINLYHKVGHGTLDMYVLSPSKDSREVREFLTKWHASDSKLFAGSHRKDSNVLSFPIQNLASICALLVWQPANPEDTITRILFPGSTPQHKIFEGFERLKHLEFLKHPVCTAKSLSPSSSLLALKDRPMIKTKLGLIEKEIKKSEVKKEKREPSESKLSKAADEVASKTTPQPSPIIPVPKSQPAKVDVKSKKVVENKKIETESKESKKIEKDLKEIKRESAKKDVSKIEKDSETKKTDISRMKTDSDKPKESKPKQEPKRKEPRESKPTKIIKADTTPKPSAKLIEKKPKSTERKDSAKASPPTPKKSTNGSATKVEVAKSTPRPIQKPAAKQPPLSTMPAKSAKDANNRKVVEQKNIEIASAASAASAATPVAAKVPAKPKGVERKPISRRTKPSSPSKARVPGSPAKSTRSTPTTSVKSDKDGVIRKVKGDRGTTDSSTVSTPSGIEIDSMTKLADKSLTEKSEDMSIDSIESKVLADLKEEREVVEEIEAVLQKAERIEEARKDDHLEGDDDITAEATDKKEDDVTEDDVTAEIEEVPKKESSRKASQELTEEDEYLIVEREEIYIEDSAQSGEGEQKHVLDAVESEKGQKLKDIDAKEEDEAEISEEKEKSDIPEKKLGSDEAIDKEKEVDDPSADHKEQLEDIIASATEIVQKTEDKDDSGKKDSEDITKEPSSLSPDKFDSSEKKTTDTDMKPEVDQKDQAIPEKMEESQERISTLESGATTTAPTLPEDERIPLDDIKEVIDEKYVADEDKEKDSVEQIKETFVAPLPTEPKPEAKHFEVRPPLQGIQREIVKTPDEVADLPVHEEVDPKLYRMDEFEKAKDEKPTQAAPSQIQAQPPQEIKEPPTPPVKEQKGVFSFFGKVADKFEKGMDKLTGKSRRDSEKDIDEKSSSKSSSPKEAKPKDTAFPVEAEEVKKDIGKIDKSPEAEAFEKGEPEVSKVKVAAIKDTAAFLQGELEELKKDALPHREAKADFAAPAETKSEAEAPELLEPIFETCVVKGDKAADKLTSVMADSQAEVEEDAEDVEALLEEASKKFKTVKDSLRDSLESLEDKIVEEEMIVRAELSTAPKDAVKDTLSEVVEKLEEIKPHIGEASPDIKEADKVKFVIPQAEEFDDEEEDSAAVTKDFKEAVRDVGEVLAGSAGILIEEKPKDVEEIVKKVAEVLKKDDFLSRDVLFDKDAPPQIDVKESDVEEKPAKPVEDIIPKKVGITVELPPQEEVDEMLEGGIARPLTSYTNVGDLEIREEPCVKTVKDEESVDSSPVKDRSEEKKEAMKICGELMQEETAPSRRKRSLPDEDESKPDVMDAGIESVCTKQEVKHQVSEEDARELEKPDIVFDRKVSPTKAEIVMMTPDSAPASPKFPIDKVHAKELEAALEEVDEEPQLAADIRKILEKDEPLEKIIEDLVFTNKTKITIEIVEYITVIRKVPREKVIYIIEEIIIKKGVPRDTVVADIDLLRPDTITTDKRSEIEQYIDQEYITKNKRITIDIVEEISIKKFVTKRIVIEIIEEIIVKRKIPRDKVIDISDKELSQIGIRRRESAAGQEAPPKESPVDEADDKEDGSTMEDKHSEIENFIVSEIISKDKKITPQLIDDICVTKRVPRRVFVEIIEEIMVKRKLPRTAILDISDKELSELLSSEKEDIDKDESVVGTGKDEEEEEEQDIDSISPEKRLQIEEDIVEEYVTKKRKITPYGFEEICVRHKIPRRVIIEIIEEIVVKRKVPRSSILDISDHELEELLAPAEDEIERESIAAVSDEEREDEQLSETKSDEIETLSPEKRSEIENGIVDEFVLKGKRITPYIFEDICVRYKVPRRVIMEIIEEIVVRRKIPRDSVLDITETELSELLAAVEAEDEQEVEIHDAPIVKKDSIVEHAEVDQLVDGFVSIPSKEDVDAEAISPISSKTIELAETALKESEKDVADDFEAVEQEYKIHDAITTAKQLPSTISAAKPDDKKLTDEIDDAIEDDTSEVVEAEEKIIGTSSKVLPESTIEKKSDEKSEVSEIVDTTEKYLIEAQEKTEPKKDEPSDKGTDEISEAQTSPPSEIVSRKDSLIHTESPEDKEPIADVAKAPSIKETERIDIKPQVEELVTAKPEEPKLIEKAIEPGVADDKITDSRKPSIVEVKEKPRETVEQAPMDECPIIEDKAELARPKRSIGDAPAEQKLSLTTQDAVEITPKSGTASPKEDKLSEEISDADEATVATVRRMVVTASSEDGGRETEVCPTGSITFTKTVTPDDSLKSSPIKTTPDQDSLHFDKESVHSGVSTPEKDSISGKSTPGTKDGDRITPDDSLDKSPSVARDSQDLEDSLDKSDPLKLKEIDKPKQPLTEEKEEQIDEESKEIVRPSEMEEPHSATVSVEKPSIDITASTDLCPKIEVVEKSLDNDKLTEEAASKSSTPSLTLGQEVDEEDEIADKPQSPSNLKDDTKELADKTHKISLEIDDKAAEKTLDKSPSPIVHDKIDDKDDLPEEKPRSRVSSVTSEKALLDHAAPTVGKQNEKEAVDILSDDGSKSPSIAGKDAASMPGTKSPTPSIEEKMSEIDQHVAHISLKVSGEKDEDEDTSDRAKSPSAVSDISDRSKSPVTHVAEDIVQVVSQSPRSRSSSIVSQKLEEKELSEKAQTDELKLPTDGSKSPGIVSDKDSKALPEPLDAATSPSAVGDKKVSEPSTDKSKSPSPERDTSKDIIESVGVSIIEGKQEPVDRSRSGSLAGIKPSEQAIKLEVTDIADISKDKEDERESVRDSRSPSITTEKHDEILGIDSTKSPSITGDKPSEEDIRELDEKVSLDHSRSPSIVGETLTEKDSKEPITKSRTPSLVSEKIDDKPSTDRSISPSIVGDKHTETDIAQLDEKEPGTRSKSPSISGDKHSEKDVKEIPDKSRSPSIASEKLDEKATADRSKSPSVVSDKHSEKDITELEYEEAVQRSREPSIVDDIKLEKPDPSKISTAKLDEVQSLDQIKSPGIVKPSEETKEPTDKSRPPSLISETIDVKAPIDHAKSPSIASDKHSEKDITEVDDEEPIRRSREPSVVGDKLSEPDDTKLEKSASPSIAGDEHDEKQISDRSRSTSIADDRHSEKDANEPLDKSRSSSVISEKVDDKTFIDRSKSPSVTSEKPSEKDVTELGDDKIAQRSRESSIAGDTKIEKIEAPSMPADKQDEKLSHDRSRSPSVSGDKPTEDESMIPVSKSRSPSIAGDRPDGDKLIENATSIVEDKASALSIDTKEAAKKVPIDHAKSPSIASDTICEKDAIKELDKSRSPSLASEKIDETVTIDRSKSPSIAGDKYIEVDISEMDKSRTPSMTSEKIDDKAPIDLSASLSVTDDKESEKDTLKFDAKPTLLSISTEKTADKASIDASKSPSIADDTLVEKEIADEADKTRSPSVAGEKLDDEASIDRSKSPSIAGDTHSEKHTIEENEKSRSLGITTEKIDDKTPVDRSRSASIADDKHSPNDVTEVVDKFTLPVTSSELTAEKSPTDHSKPASVVGDTHSEKDVLDVDAKSRTPSIASEKSDDKPSIDHSRSRSVIDDKDSEKDASKLDGRLSPLSIPTEKPTDTVTIDHTESPSIAGDTHSEKDETEGDKSKSPSITGEKLDEPGSIDRSKSPSIAGDKHSEKDVLELDDKSRSPSVTSEKVDYRTPIDRSRSPSIAGDKHSEKDIAELEEKSRSPSITSGKFDDKTPIDRPQSPIVTAEKEMSKDTSKSDDKPISLDIQIEKTDSTMPVDHSKSPSIAGETLSEKDIVEEDEKSRTSSRATTEKDAPIAVDEKPRSASITSVKTDAKSPSVAGDMLSEMDVADDKSKSPSIVDDKYSEKDFTEVDEKSRKSSIASEKHDEKISIDDFKSPRIAGDKPSEKDVIQLDEKSRSPSIVDDKQSEEDSTERDDKSKSPSITTDKVDDKVYIERSRSPSIAGDKDPLKPDDKPTSLAISADKVADKAPIEHSKSPRITSDALDEKGITAESDKSRSPSVADDKIDGKVHTDHSRSPSIAGDKRSEKDVAEESDKSRSPSIASVTPIEKVSVDHAKSPSLADDKQSEKDIAEKGDKFKTPSIADDKDDDKGLIDRSRSPSIAGDKPSVKEATAEGREFRSPSIACEKPDEKVPTDLLKSSSIAGDKQSEKDIAEETDKSRSPSITGDKPDEKSPSIAGDKPSEKDVIEEADKSRSPSIASEKPDEKAVIDRSKSPSLAGDKPSEKDVAEEADKSRSPSIASEKPDEKAAIDRPKSPSIAGDKPSEKDVAEDADKSRSPSIASEKPDEKAVIDRPKSPSIAGDKPSEKDVAEETDKSRSPSIASEKPDEKAVIDRSKSPSIAGDKPSEKDVAEEADKSRSPSIASEKPDEKAVIDRSKSPSIAGDKSSEKDITEEADRSRSPSIASEKPDEKAVIDRSKSPSIAGDKPSEKDVTEEADKSRSPSIASEKPDEKVVIDRSKSPSIAGEKPSEKDVTEEADKSRSSSLASEKPDEKAVIDRSKSPSIAGDKPSEKDVTEEADKSRSPSIASEKPDEKAVIDRSKSPSIAGDKPSEKDVADEADKSRSPSIASEKPDEKAVIDRSKSPSIAGDKPSEIDVAEETDKSRSPSIASEKPDEKAVIDRSKSPSIAGDKPSEKDVAEEADRSRSPSIASEKLDEKAVIDRSKSPSIAGDKPSEKDVAEEADKSRSPSIDSEKPDEKAVIDRSKSPSIAGDKPSEKNVAEEADKSRSPSISSEKPDEKAVIDRSKSPSIAGDKHSEKDVAEEADRSRSPSIASEKLDEKAVIDRSKSPSIAGDEPSEKDVAEEADKSRSPSIDSEKPDEKAVIDRSKSPSIAGDKPSEKNVAEEADKSRSPSISSEKPDEKAVIDRSKSPSIAGDKHSEKDVTEEVDKSRSPSIAGDKRSEKDAAEEADKSRSPSISSEKPDEKAVIDSSKLPSIAGDKPSEKNVAEEADKSRSPSISSEKPDEKAAIDRSKSPSVAGDKHTEKDVGEETDKSRSPSITSEKPDEKVLIDRSKSPSIAGDKHSEKDIEETDKSRSPSIASEKPDDKAVIDRSESSSIAGDKHSEKDVAEEVDKPRSPSVTSEKPDEKVLIDRSKSPSIAGDKHSDKDVVEEADKSRSPSIADDKHSGKDVEETDKSRSPSIAGDKHSEKDVEESEKSRSPSVTSEKPDEKSPSIAGEKSGSPSTIDDKADEKKKEVVAKDDDESRSPSLTGDKSPIDRSKSPLRGTAGDKHDEIESFDRSRSASIVDDKQSIEKDVTKPIEKSRSPSISGEKHDGPIDLSKQSSESVPIELSTKLVDRSRSSSIVAPTDITDHEKSPESSKTTELSTDEKTITAEIDILKGKQSIDARSPSDIEGKIDEKIVERKKRSASVESDLVDDEKKDVLDVDKRKRASIVDAHEADIKTVDKRKDSLSSVDDSKRDEKDGAQALQKLAETIADTDSSGAKQLTKSPLDETMPDETPKDRSRSHSLFDTGEKTPLGRSRAASLFEDKVPEVLSSHVETKAAFQVPGGTYIYDESDETKEDISRKSSLNDMSDERKKSLIGDSRKSSIAKIEIDTLRKSSSMAIDDDIAGQFADDYHTTRNEILKVEEYIVNRYIVKRVKITWKIIEEIAALYSMPKYMISELIEAIIMKRVPSDSAIDYPKDDGIFDMAVGSKDDHVDVIDIPVSKRKDIESYINDEYLTKNIIISSKIVDELANVKSVSRYIIITIIEEIITKRKIPRGNVVESGLFDELSRSAIDSKRSSIASHGSRGDEKDFEDGNLPSISTDYKSSSIPSTKSKESAISEEKRVEIESYVMEECVKKGKKITVLILDEIMRNMSVSRQILLEIIENIIVTRKMSRETMVDDAIYDEIEESEYKYDDKMEKSISELSSKDRIVEFSGKSTPEARGYDDKFGKEISYTTDYESPFHKAFVGGMTEIRTTHITTLSGKSTPDFGTRGDTPESLSESMTSSSQTKIDVRMPLDKSSPADVSGYEYTETTTQPLSISPTRVATTTTTTTTVTTAVESPPVRNDDGTSVFAEKSLGQPDSDSVIMVKKEIGQSETREIHDEENEPEVIRRKIIENDDDEPEVIRKVIRREIIEDDDEPEVIRKVIRREIIEEDEPEVITRIVRREIVEQHDDDDDDDDDEAAEEYEERTITRRIGTQEGSPESVETITTSTRKTIVREDSPEKIASESISADVRRTVTTVTTVTEPNGKVTTKKDVRESTDKLEGDELLERLMDSTKSEDSGKLTDAKSIESLTTEKIITETIKTMTTEKIPFDLGWQEEKSVGKMVDKPEHARSSIIKELISDDRSYSGKSSSEVSSAKDVSSGKSTPDVPPASLTKDSTTGHAQISGRSTPDRRADSRSSTATPEGFRSSEVIRTTITTTRTMSEDGDIITTTKEITETTNEKGETTVLAEKTDVKVEDRAPSREMSESIYGGFEGSKDLPPASPRSDHSRSGTHAWPPSDDRHTYSDDEMPGSPLSTTSQVGYSPQSTYHFGEQTFDKDSSRKSMEFSDAVMSGSFYGELPDLPPRVTTLKSAYLESTGSETSGSSDADFSFKKFTVEKELAAGGYSDKSAGKRYVDDADLDFEKALMERKEMKRDREHSSAVGTDTITNGSLTKSTGSSATTGMPTAMSTTSDDGNEPKDDPKKDPLESWGTPLGLPSPKPPRKFNLRTTARSTDSTDISPDSLNFDVINDWGEPLRLPSPAPIADEASNKGAPATPKKERKQPKKVISENLKNRKRSESPSKNEKKSKDTKNKVQPVYMDLTYVPHHGNSYYTSLEFFKRVRARYYVFSGTEPSREVYDALLDAKKTWEDKDLEVTMIPTYDTDTLGYWVADNEEALAANHIDLSPSASRCTINLQDHETSCSAYRLEF